MRTKALIFGTVLLLGSMVAGSVQAQVDDPSLGDAGTTTGSGGFGGGDTGAGGYADTGTGDGYLPATGGDPLSLVAAGAALSGAGVALLRRRRIVK